MDRQARMAAVLTQALAPMRMEIEDESARHAGHSGASPAGETHYRIAIVSESFTDLSRVQRSRLVHDVLGVEFQAGLHALSLKLRSPREM